MIKLPEPVGGAYVRTFQSVRETKTEWIDKVYTEAQLKQAVRDAYEEAAQPERAPLSDAEIEDLRGEANRGYCIDKGAYFKAFRDAEQAHGIKQGGQQ